jgi:hypothetical protein
MQKGDNHRHLAANEPTYLLFQFMVEFEGDHPPKGAGNTAKTLIDTPYWNVLPKQYEDRTTILYVEPGMSGPVYANAPDQSIWPSEAQ